MKGIIKKNRPYFSFLVSLLLLIFLSACGGVTPTTPIINSFTASSTSITEGEVVTLSWAVTNATTLSINQGIGAVGLSGSTSVSPTSTTTYILTATNSTDSNTATVTITVNPTVILEQNIIIQPGPIEGKDCDVSSSTAVVNFGNYPNLFIGNTIDPSIARAYLQFNLSAIPTGVDIVSADLKLYHNSSTGTTDLTIRIHKVTSSWQENTLTWINQPDYHPTPESSRLVNVDITDWLSWDITNLLQEWLDGSTPNYGLVLKDTDEALGNTYIQCFSSDYIDETSLRPKLEIIYLAPAP
jgi:hypothetical protein